MDDPEYSRKLAQEAEIWSAIAEKQAIELPPDWRYHRELRVNAIMRVADIDMLLRHVHPDFNVLELGCGSGWLTVALARRGAYAHGLDVGEKALEIARSYYESIKGDIAGIATYEVADLNTIDLPVEQYDVVVAKGVLHHLLDPVYLVDQIYQSLKPGGLFWVCDTNGEETLPVALVAGALTFFLPTQVSYHDKINGLLRFGLRAPERIKASMQADGSSPFEGAGRAQDWVQAVRERFAIERRLDHPSLSGYISAQLRMSDRLALPLLRILSKLDRTLVRYGVLHTTGITLYARKFLWHTKS